ncbi:YtpI family protein [Paenibacillus sp. R14(2021)]|uniref:YtpI family protein n=1 Tax=Paenibacillus sp. R14(2021) TaxID=2859228 RepID=UPI001C612BAB|nr:YtpI family protein [Paenibacillus sp. R14(2021)]
MVNALHWAIVIIICFTSLLSVYFSFQSRRTSDNRRRGILGARMNMSMGVMLIFIALFMMLAYTGSTVKVIIGALIIVIGLFNLFAGLRNHSIYRSMRG